MSYTEQKKINKNRKKSKIASYLLLLFMFGAIGAGGAYVVYYGYAIKKATIKSGDIYIPTGSTLADQAALLYDNGFLKDSADYIRFANKLNFTKVYPGRYKIEEGWPLKSLYRVIGTGAQTSVRVAFNNIRTFDKLASVVSKKLEVDSVALMSAFLNDSIQQSYGFDSKNFISMFIPNSYDLYWSCSAEEFVARMNREYNTFWSAKERDEKAKALGMSRQEVSTLASIVIEESKAEQEFKRIAGVYINRLKKSMPLQADPTVKYALGDITIKRVLYKHLEVDSPYNTYKVAGLPPGPICQPPIAAIDAVLDYEQHGYYYFCASDQLNGLHLFATNLSQHNRNAALYAAALNRRGIR